MSFNYAHLLIVFTVFPVNANSDKSSEASLVLCGGFDGRDLTTAAYMLRYQHNASDHLPSFHHWVCLAACDKAN